MKQMLIVIMVLHFLREFIQCNILILDGLGAEQRRGLIVLDRQTLRSYQGLQSIPKYGLLFCPMPASFITIECYNFSGLCLN